jgi:hypothetical protein
MLCFRFFGVIMLLLAFSATPGQAQRNPPPSALDPAQGVAPGPDPSAQRKLLTQMRKQRFEDMQRDSRKLLELAVELKQYVDNSGENILSLDVVRKAEEMEKLARQVKNNMRGD